MHAYIHTHRHTYIHTHTYIPTYVRTYIHTYVRTYIHTYVRTYVHTYIQTFIYIHLHICIKMWGFVIICHDERLSYRYNPFSDTQIMLSVWFYYFISIYYRPLDHQITMKCWVIPSHGKRCYPSTGLFQWRLGQADLQGMGLVCRRLGIKCSLVQQRQFLLDLENTTLKRKFCMFETWVSFSFRERNILTAIFYQFVCAI